MPLPSEVFIHSSLAHISIGLQNQTQSRSHPLPSPPGWDVIRCGRYNKCDLVAVKIVVNREAVYRRLAQSIYNSAVGSELIDYETLGAFLHFSKSQ